MTTYVIRRLIQAVATLFLLSILLFLLVRINGGSPCPPGSLGCAETFHLNEPVTNQYFEWIGPFLRGDFGLSNGGQPISGILQQKFPPTVVLVGVSLVLQQIIALPLGIIAALRPYSVLDSVLTFFSYVALSLPAFLLGFLLIFLFGVQWHLFPIAHSADVALPLLGSIDWFDALRHDPTYVLGDMVRHLVLPAFTLIAIGIAIDSRFMRAAMLQVLHEDYVRTARSKGLSRRRVIFKHAFRNALLPIITNLGLYLPALIGGAVVVESVFTWGGLGSAFSTAINGGSPFGFVQQSDRNLLLAMVMLSAVAVVIANLLADLAYLWLDPRVRLEGGVD